MKLKFTGEDGSMGYKRDWTYDVRIHCESVIHHGAFVDCIWVKVVNMPSVPYESPQAFAANWCKP